MVETNNLFLRIPDVLPEEIFDVLIEEPSLRLERIVSDGHAAPPREWYDQDRDEWVVLLSGSAGLLFEGEAEPVVMKPGDYVLIPAHLRHRVEWTDGSEKTVWLALHFTASSDPQAGR
jgi:cupin 2 domain-containing protein